MKTLLVTCLAAAACANATAQHTVYSCGPDARTYSQQPCAQGLALDVADPRTPEQQREARTVAALDARLAAALSQERRERERATTQQGAAHLGPVRGIPAAATSASTKATRKTQKKAPLDPRLTPPMRGLTPQG
jgi:hypothetical protein